MKRVGIVLLVLVIAVVGFLFFPRAGGLSVANAATLTVLHGQVDAQKAGGDFAPAYDGDLLTTGDVVRADGAGNAVITFFDGSTLTVQSGAQMKVVSLVKSGEGSLQVSIEQTLGRTWASVQKLGPNGKFEVKTPSSTAVVRGTAFETIVEVVNGVQTTTVKTTEGEVVVQAQAGGQTSVAAGQQVEVPQGAQAPANSAPQPPTPRLRFTPSPNVGITVIDPRGLQCSIGSRQIPGCDFSGQVITIDGPRSGQYSIAMTAAAAAPNATLSLIASRGATTDLTTGFTANLSLGDLLRTTVGVTVPDTGALTSSGFTPGELITSVCGAEAKGRVFSSGDINVRADALNAYGRSASKQPASIVYSAAELTKAAVDGLATVSLPVQVSGLAVTIDRDGMKLSAQANAGPVTVPATASIIAGARDGRLFIRTRDLDLGAAPGAVKDQLVASLDKSFAEFAASLALDVDRVAFRNGCFAVIGTTR